MGALLARQHILLLGPLRGVGYVFGWGHIPRNAPQNGFNHIPLFYHFNLEGQDECIAIRALAPVNLPGDHLIANQDTANIHIIVMNHNCFNIIILTIKFVGTCIVVYFIYKFS